MSNGKTTTIEISIEVRDKLHDIGRRLEIITHRNSFSFDQILKVMLTVEPLDQILKVMLTVEPLDTILEKLMMEKF